MPMLLSLIGGAITTGGGALAGWLRGRSKLTADIVGNLTENAQRVVEAQYVAPTKMASTVRNNLPVEAKLTAEQQAEATRLALDTLLRDMGKAGIDTGRKFALPILEAGIKAAVARGKRGPTLPPGASVLLPCLILLVGLTSCATGPQGIPG